MQCDEPISLQRVITHGSTKGDGWWPGGSNGDAPARYWQERVDSTMAETAPQEPCMDKSEGAKVSRLADIIWRMWPWMTWSLPVALVLVPAMSPGAGWYALFLLLLSPVIVAGAGLLGSLPRFVLRRAGHESAPVGLVWLLLLHWWSWIAVILTFRDASDVGPVPSALSRLAPEPVSYDSVDVIRQAAGVVVVVTWLAVVTRVAAGGPFPRPAYLVAAGYVTILAAPALLIVATMHASEETASQRDDAGERAGDIADHSAEAQKQRYETRYVELQESMVPMREAIAPDGWEATVRLQEARSADGSTGFDAYSVQLSYRLDRALEDSEFNQVDRLLDDAGWEQNDSPMTSDAEFEHPGGAEVDLITSEDHLVIRMESPVWWGDEDVLRDPPEERDGPLTTEDRDEVMREEPTYAADEWPEAP